MELGLKMIDLEEYKRNVMRYRQLKPLSPGAAQRTLTDEELTEASRITEYLSETVTQLSTEDLNELREWAREEL